MKQIDNLRQFVIKHRERVVLGGMGVGLLLFILVGMYLQRAGQQDKVDPVVKTPEKIELKIPEKDNGRGKSGEQNASYFLKPSPRELLDQLTSMENLNEDVVQKKFSGIRVLWPLYFFNITDEGGGGLKTALFDVSEDGFGTLVQMTVEMDKYPELLEMEQGKAMWVGGEITAVDLSGTGTIYLKLEQLSSNKDNFLQSSAAPAEENEN